MTHESFGELLERVRLRQPKDRRTFAAFAAFLSEDPLPGESPRVWADSTYEAWEKGTNRPRPHNVARMARGLARAGEPIDLMLLRGICAAPKPERPGASGVAPKARKARAA